MNAFGCLTGLKLLRYITACVLLVGRDGATGKPSLVELDGVRRERSPDEHPMGIRPGLLVAPAEAD